MDEIWRRRREAGTDGEIEPEPGTRPGDDISGPEFLERVKRNIPGIENTPESAKLVRLVEASEKLFGRKPSQDEADGD